MPESQPADRIPCLSVEQLPPLVVVEGGECVVQRLELQVSRHWEPSAVGSFSPFHVALTATSLLQVLNFIIVMIAENQN